MIKESGPPHMRTFVTQCRVGALKADGEGIFFKPADFEAFFRRKREENFEKTRRWKNARWAREATALGPDADSS